VVCLAPVPGWVRQLWPGCSVTVATSRVSVPIARVWPGADEVLERPSGLVQRAAFLPRLRGFDAALLTYAQNTMLRLCRVAGVPTLTVGYDRLPAGGLANEPYLAAEPESPAAVARLLAGLGADTSESRPRLDLPQGALAAAEAALAGSGGPWLGLMVGASHPAKVWPAERFAEVARAARERGMTPVFVGGPSEVEPSAAAAPPGSLVLAGQLDVLGTAAVLARCERLVTNDTGAMHLARAVGTPVTAVLGPTPRHHFAAFAAPDVALRGRCSWGCGTYEACRLECILAVPVEAVVATLGGE
jgi:ADP-heptose:LPS heptosyltransferase